MAKTEVEDTLKLSINWLQSNTPFEAGTFYNGSITWTSRGYGEETKNSISYQLDLTEGERPKITLIYNTTDRHTGEKSKFNYPVFLTKTKTNFKGSRYWFTCPNITCQKRVACLYKSNNKYFLCRECLNLAYHSQNENRRGRWWVLGALMDNERKAEDLYKKKRWQTHYMGRATKRYKRYCRLYNYSGIQFSNFVKNNQSFLNS